MTCMYAYNIMLLPLQGLSYITRLSDKYTRMVMFQNEKLHVLLYICMHTYISGRSAVFPCHGGT